MDYFLQYSVNGALVLYTLSSITFSAIYKLSPRGGAASMQSA